MKDDALGQEIIAGPQGILDGPLHAEPQFPLPAGHVGTLLGAIDAMQDRIVLGWRMRNGETHCDAAGHKSEPGEDARRSDDVGRIQDFFAGPLVHDRGDPSAAVGTDRHSKLLVLQRDEPVLLHYGSW